MADFRVRFSSNVYTTRAPAWFGSNRRKTAYKWTKPIDVNDTIARSNTNSVKANPKASHHHVVSSIKSRSAPSRHRVWRASECVGAVAVNRGGCNPGNQSSNVSVVDKSKTATVKPTVHVRVTPACRKTAAASGIAVDKARRKSVEFVSKFALKRKSGSVSRSVPVMRKSALGTAASRPTKTSLNSRYKLVKKPLILSPKVEKSKATEETVATLPSETTKSQNSFKKVSSYRLQRDVMEPSTKQCSRQQDNTNTKQYNSNQPTTPSHSVSVLASGRSSQNSEQKSRFKLVRLRRSSSHSRALVDTSQRVMPSRCRQRQASCEKRVTRYKLIRVRKQQGNSRLSSFNLKLKTHYKLVRVGQPFTRPVRRLSANRSQRKGKSLVNRSMARQLIRKVDGSFVLKSRYCLVRNSGSGVSSCQQSGSVHKIGCQVSHESSIRKHQVTIQSTAHKLVRRSLSFVRATNKKLLKTNPKKFCMFFNRFGRCKRGSSCAYIHDPDKVAVCTKFMRGVCGKMDGSCRFSHVISKDKMPACSFFLRGRCSNDNCPFSHVRVGKSASICEHFLRGYCPEGQKCNSKHVLLCPKFAASGMCPNPGKCTLYHQNRSMTRTKRRRSSDSQGDNHNPVKRHLASGVRVPTAFKLRPKKGKQFLRQHQDTVVTDVAIGQPQAHHNAFSSLPIKPSFLED